MIRRVGKLLYLFDMRVIKNRFVHPMKVSIDRCGCAETNKTIWAKKKISLGELWLLKLRAEKKQRKYASNELRELVSVTVGLEAFEQLLQFEKELRELEARFSERPTGISPQLW